MIFTKVYREGRGVCCRYVMGIETEALDEG